MIELYTARWKNKDLARLECQPVSISRGDGRGARFRFRKLWDLAPSSETFAMSDSATAKASYRDGLEEIGVEQIQARLQELYSEAGELPLVLLCHEDVLGQGQECHRRWFADWWLERTGIEIPELQPGDLRDGAEVRQPRLL